MVEVKLETGRFSQAFRESKAQFDAAEVPGWVAAHLAFVLGMFDILLNVWMLIWSVLVLVWIVRHW